MKILTLPLLAFFAFEPAFAEKIVKAQGKATWKDKTLYTEKQEIHLDDQGKVLKTITTYEDADGKALAIMTAEFSDSLAIPNHHFKDERSEHTYGIRKNNGNVVLYEKAKDKDERSKEIPADFKTDRLKVAGPGLGFYLKEHLDEFRAKKEVPITLMIPGNLDTYDFKVVLEREAGGVAEFDVVIQNWFLRLFAPRIRFKYDTRFDRILFYEGVSNLKDEKENMQKVMIDYFYD